MLKLIKYLKPYGWLIAIIFVLLFAQAMTDLTLPDYMSRIVNIGIQQNGIENNVPQVIRTSEMDKLMLFMNDDDKVFVAENYILLDKASLSASDYESYLAEYPGLAESPLYKLNTDDGAAIDRLNTIFGKPMLLVSALEKGGLEAFPGAPTLPTGTDPFTWLAGLPPDQLAALRDSALTNLNKVPESVIDQSAIAYVAAEYEIIGVDVNSMQTSYILRIGGLMLLLTFIGTAFSIGVGYLAALISAGFARATRRKIFNKVENFSNTEFDKFSTASLITRTTNDIQQIQMVLVMLLRIVFYAPIIGIGGIIKALGQDMSMSWIIAAAVMALLTMIGVVFIIAVPKFRIIQKLVDRLNLVSREMLTGIMVVRAFNTQAHEEKKFDVANTELTKTNFFINKVMVFLMPAMMLIMNGAMLMVIWFGAHQVDAGAMQVGNMMAFMQYTMLIIMAFLMVSMIFIMLPRATVSAQRISEVLETEPSITDPPVPVKLNGALKGVVQFENVSFKYPGAEDYVLHNISFTAQPGQTTAFIGGTGSGKSTLVNLIPRFYDVTEGRILVENTDIRTITQHDLRDKIGYVPQKTILFSGTIESNLKYANEAASAAEIEKAAETAQALDFIKEYKQGFQTSIAQSGTNLSGGQKQRLAIARALAKMPDIYIFDDSFSAIDFRTDAALRRALKKDTQHSTVLIVAQRISTIMNADQIIVLENGRVADKGTHKELMERCKVYQELALSQLSREELT